MNDAEMVSDFLYLGISYSAFMCVPFCVLVWVQIQMAKDA